MRVFVTGAGGFVGRYTVRALAAAGHSVIGLVRRQADAPPGVSLVTGSITDSSTAELAALMSRCDAVVHLVGIIAETDGQTFESVHVHGTSNVINAARLAGAGQTRFVYVSSIGASLSARSAYSRTKAQAEELVIGSGLPRTIFRPSAILGPGGEFLEQVVSLVRKPPLSPFPLPFAPVPGDGQNRFQPVFIDDLTRCLVACLSDPQTANQTYEIGGSDEVTFDEMVAAVGKRIGIRKSILHVPMPIMRAAVSALQHVIADPPVTMEQLGLLSTDSVCDNGPVRSAFRFVPMTFDATIDRCFM